MRSADKRLGRRGRRQVISAAIQALEPRVLLSTINGNGPDDPDGSPAPTGLTPVVTQSPTGASSTFPALQRPPTPFRPGGQGPALSRLHRAARPKPGVPTPSRPPPPSTRMEIPPPSAPVNWPPSSRSGPSSPRLTPPSTSTFTTVAPASLVHNQNLEIVVGGNGAWTGGSYGGLSYTGAFSNSFEPNVSWVFSNNLANAPFYCGEASSHEAGHEFGLNHQSVWSGTTLVDEYNPGNSLTAHPSWVDSLRRFRGRAGCGGTAPAVTSPAPPFRTGHGGDLLLHQRIWLPDPRTTASPSRPPMRLSLSGTNVSGSGIIEKTSDTDFFSFSTAAGSVTLNVNDDCLRGHDARQVAAFQRFGER